MSGKDFFDNLSEKMTSGPVKTLALTKPDAVAAWRELIGPTNPEAAKEEAPESIRALFGDNITENAVHGSDSAVSAHRELYIMFPGKL